MKVYAQQHDNLDALLYRHFGTSNGMLEETLKLNPKLANQPQLTIGTPVILPDKSVKQQIKPSIKLWD